MSNRRPFFLAKLTISALVIIMFTGCVTSSDSRFARGADEDAAVRDYVQLATAYVAQGNYERARTHIERALEINPDSHGALATMGLIFQREGEPELAEKAFKDSLKQEPSYTRGRVFYAAFLYEQGEYRKARDEFAMAAADTGYPDRASVFYNLGRAEQRLGNASAAAEAFKRSVRLSRGDARSLLALATALADAGEYDEAARHYDRLMAIMARSERISHSPESLLTGIRIARSQGNQDRAASLALVLKNQFPNSEQYQKYKALMSDDK